MSDTPVKTPLVEMLRSIPADACDNYDVSPFMSHHVPYGRHLHDAADEIEALERDRDEWKAKAEANERDAERLLQICGPHGFLDGIDDFDFHEGAAERAFENGRDEPNDEDYLASIRFGLDAARSAEKEKE